MPTASLAEGVALQLFETPPSLSSLKIRPGWLSALVLTVGLGAVVGGGLVHAFLRKDITIVAGRRAITHTTYKRTVAQALLEAGVLLSDEDEVSPAMSTRLREGHRIVVRGAVPLTLKIDGKTLALRSAGPTVRDLLRKRRLIVHERDRVFPTPGTPVWAGMTIRVVRIEHRMLLEQEEIPYQVLTSSDPLIPRGIVRVKAPGRTGLKERAFKVTLADGKGTARQLIGERVVRNPLDRVIKIGAQVQMASRGQFAGREMLEMVATAYSPFCCPGVDNITAVGMFAGYGVVAVDPTVIPLRSRLYIEGYGYAVAGDTGSRIKGMRIDLGFDNKHEAIRYGRRPVRVYILHKQEPKRRSQSTESS